MSSWHTVFSYSENTTHFRIPFNTSHFAMHYSLLSLNFPHILYRNKKHSKAYRYLLLHCRCYPYIPLNMTCLLLWLKFHLSAPSVSNIYIYINKQSLSISSPSNKHFIRHTLFTYHLLVASVYRSALHWSYPFSSTPYYSWGIMEVFRAPDI